jgi:hypothetical protein
MYNVNKKCSKCGETKPVNEFYKSSHHYSSWCKQCCRDRSHIQVVNGYSKARWEKILSTRPEKRKIFVPENKIDSILHSIASNHCGNIKKRVKIKGYSISCDVDTDFLYGLIKQFCKENYYTLEPQSPFRPSVDRIDSSKGYTKDNVRIVWFIENLAKNSWTDDVVMEFCKRKLGLL